METGVMQNFIFSLDIRWTYLPIAKNALPIIEVNTMKIFKYMALASLKVLITLTGLANSLMFSAGWLIQMPSILFSYCMAKRENNIVAEEILRNRLEEPVRGTKMWSEALVEMWTCWEV